ncbi:MAG TPA: CNNM domain-containing protein [Verrucomicrobiae bacterium]|nr:CNNM domain-containing protein [Verrucomicrobiae bacterium]
MAFNSITLMAVTFCLVLSFFLSGMEAGVFALSRLRIRRQGRAGVRSAQLLHEYLDNPENFLWTILVGNTVANALILGWLVFVLDHYLFARLGWFIAVYAVAVFFFYAFFDFLPKMVFRTFPTRLCIFFARPFRLVHTLLRPLVGAVEWVSDLVLRWRGGKAFTGRLFGNREELRLVMQDPSQTLTTEERGMINRVLDLQTITVRQVMLPLSRAATVNTQTPISEVLRICKETSLTRLPVWQDRDGQRRIVGLLHINSLLYNPGLDPSRLAGEHTKPALYLDEDLRLEVALRRMQRGGQRLAIVLARDRREIGILSLQDVLKVIFGEVSL